MSVAESPATTRWRLADLIVPVGSVGLLVLMIGLVLASAGKTLGYDYTCYEGAARHLLDGKPIYDNAFSIAVGTCPGTYTYPPAFAVALVPWLLFGGAATGAWCVAMAACFLAGVALMPVRRDVRWLIVIVAALDWPLLYAVKLGQVEPILFLAFAAAWRWMDRPWAVGVATAVGTLVKVQPALLGVWAVTTGRWRAVGVAVGVAAATAAIVTVFTGIGVWTDYIALLGRVSSAVATPHNCSPGAALYQAGLPETVAGVGQWASMVVTGAAVLLIWRYGRSEVGLMGTIVASQLLTPLLWDHYAMLLLLPTAWLLERGRTWAALFPLVGWISLFDSNGAWPAIASIPLTFFGVLVVLLFEAYRERSNPALGHP